MKLLITDCSDPQMWYAKRIGEVVPLIRRYSEGWYSAEPGGYLNIVLEQDAVPVPDDATADRVRNIVARLAERKGANKK